MIICKECSGTKMKSRSNFSHGNKSGSRTRYTCKNCGSSRVERKIVRRGRSR